MEFLTTNWNKSSSRLDYTKQLIKALLRISQPRNLRKVKEFLICIDIEKGLPNQTNYISECYPGIPLSGASVSQYQKQMFEITNRKKKSLEMMKKNAFHDKQTPEQSAKSHRRHKSYHQRHTRRHEARSDLPGQFERADQSEIIEKPRKHHRRHSHKNGNLQKCNIDIDL